jgi:hypothetical protein
MPPTAFSQSERPPISATPIGACWRRSRVLSLQPRHGEIYDGRVAVPPREAASEGCCARPLASALSLGIPAHPRRISASARYAWHGGDHGSGAFGRTEQFRFYEPHTYDGDFPSICSLNHVNSALLLKNKRSVGLLPKYNSKARNSASSALPHALDPVMVACIGRRGRGRSARGAPLGDRGSVHTVQTGPLIPISNNCQSIREVAYARHPRDSRTRSAD